VELVEHDRAEVGEQRIVLKPCGQDAFGRNQELRSWTESPFEANLPADFPTDRPSPLVRDPLRDGASRDTSRLEQDDRAFFDQRGRYPRCLAGAGLGGDDNRARPPNSLGDRRDERIDWK
jgi:hypothetical protein